MKYKHLILSLSLIMLGPLAHAEEIGSVDTVFKMIGPDHKIVVEAFDDPDVKNVTSHIMRLLISLWDVGTVFFTIYPQVFRHEKSSIYYKYIEPLSYCFSISFKILIITVYGFMKWYICKCLFCKVYLLDLSYNRNAKPMTGSNELRFNLTQIRG